MSARLPPVCCRVVCVALVVTVHRIATASHFVAGCCDRTCEACGHDCCNGATMRTLTRESLLCVVAVVCGRSVGTCGSHCPCDACGCCIVAVLCVVAAAAVIVAAADRLLLVSHPAVVFAALMTRCRGV